MKKKFAVVRVHGYMGTFISIMSQDEFATTLCDCDILFESDNLVETSDFYQDYIHTFSDK